MDLNAAKDDSNSEVQAKVRLAREKEQLFSDYTELKEKFKVQINFCRYWLCHMIVTLLQRQWRKRINVSLKRKKTLKLNWSQLPP